MGVDDRSRDVRGIADPLDEEERLANLISDRISPRLVPEIEILPWRRSQVLALQVHPSPSRPHHLIREGPAAGVYVRVGSTNRRADAEQIEELRRFSRGEDFDEQPLPGLSSEALDFRAASETFAPFRALRRRDLETLRLVCDHQGRKVPTVGGMILFGHDRERHFPDAWIQAGRFGGTDKSRILDRVEIHSFPVLAVEEAIAIVQNHSWHGAAIGAVRRTDRWTLPPEAVREALINAVVHADYSQRGALIRLSMLDDRLEIENPGLLPFGLTVDDLPHGVSKLRNRVIGRVFQALGLIEQWGSGIQRINAVCRDAGLPPLIFEEIATRFRVTIPTAPVGPTVVDKTDQAIFASLAEGQGLATSEIAAFIGLSTRATRTRLARLDIDAALEAAGHTLSGVEIQLGKYAAGLPAGLNPPVRPLPFVYMSTGVETRFINGLDPDPKTRTISANLPHIHRPETLAEWIQAETLDAWVKRLHAEGGGLYTAAEDTQPASLRGRINTLPPLQPGTLYANQIPLLRHPKLRACHSGAALDRPKTGCGAVSLEIQWWHAGDWGDPCLCRMVQWAA